MTAVLPVLRFYCLRCHLISCKECDASLALTQLWPGLAFGRDVLSSSMICTFIILTTLLGVSAAASANFTTVFVWDELDFNWPSEKNRTVAVRNGTFKPSNIRPLFMAVSGQRIFLSLQPHPGVPATLVWIPTNATAPPKLNPFPSWKTHVTDSCSHQIQSVTGLEVDTNGNLWALDNVSNSLLCRPKLLIFNLDSDSIIINYEFPSYFYTKQGGLHDLVLKQEDDDWIAYITDKYNDHLIIFSLKKKISWSVRVPEKRLAAIALSPKANGSKWLYVSDAEGAVYSISAFNTKRYIPPISKADLKPIGTWVAVPYRMLSDSDGEVYLAFNQEVYINNMNTKRLPNPNIGRFYELKTHLPELMVNGFLSKRFHSFAIDSSGTFWLMFHYENQKPMLLKTALNTRSYLYDPPKEGPRSGINIPISTDNEEQDHRITTRLSIIIPVCIFGVAFILWILLWKETGQISIQHQQSMNENRVELGLPAEQPVYHEIQESPEYEFVPATPLFPVTDFSTEYDDVGPAESEEVLYDDVGPGSAASVQYEEMNCELTDLYLRILPDDVNEIYQN